MPATPPDASLNSPAPKSTGEAMVEALDRVLSPDTDTPEPVSLERLAHNVNERLKIVNEAITRRREDRDRINAEIKKLTAERVDLERVAKSFNPRTQKPRGAE